METLDNNETRCMKKITGNPETGKAWKLILSFFPNHLVTGIMILLGRPQTL